MSLPKPNYTQIPNLFFDAMPDMKEGELRILLAVARQTFGYHRESDYLSITQFCKMTGLSRQGVANGIKAAVKRGWLSEIGTGKRGMRLWKLALVNEVDQSTEATSQLSSIVPVNEVDQTPPATIQPSRNTKERIPKEKGKKATPTPDPFGDSMKPEYAAYLDAWRNAHDGVKPIALRGKERTDAIDDVKDLVEMGCTIDDLTAFVQERQKNGKSTVWKFMVKDIHEFMTRKQKKIAANSKVAPIRSDIHYVEETNETMIFNWEVGRWDTYPGKLESRPA